MSSPSQCNARPSGHCWGGALKDKNLTVEVVDSHSLGVRSTCYLYWPRHRSELRTVRQGLVSELDATKGQV